MIYAQVTNTGSGFYTHEDREKIPDFSLHGNVAILTDNADAVKWVERVKGKILTKAETNTKLEDAFDAGKITRVAEIQAELTAEQAKAFDSTDFSSDLAGT